MKPFARSMFSNLAWTLVTFFLVGTAPHIDEQLHLTVKGEASCSPLCRHQLEVTLIGTNLGNAPAKREIATASLGRSGGSFLLIGSVPVSYKGEPSVPPSERTVTLEIRSSGCSVVSRSLLLGSFTRDKYGYLLDVGAIKIDCGLKGS